MTSSKKIRKMVSEERHLRDRNRSNTRHDIFNPQADCGKADRNRFHVYPTKP